MTLERPSTASVAEAPASFGDLLRWLRVRARLNQRELAQAVGYSESQISRLEQGKRLPDPAVVRTLFIPSLQLHDAPDLAAKLLDLAAATRNEPLMPLPGHHAHVLPSQLPAPLTSLINRTEEVQHIHAILRRPDVRLLTLVGPPGIGKTRLSLHVAVECQAQFADGVCFVSLAPVDSPDLVLPAIMRALELRDSGATPLTILTSALRERELLLVLDNFEQVLDVAPQVAALLRAAPKVRALVTSRAPLHISGEHRYPMPPLDLPSLRDLPPLEQIAAYPAVQLFTARVRAVRPGFELTPDNAPAVVEICTRLDGLPLAIELAAARCASFTPQALLHRLRGPDGPAALRVLVDGPRDLLVHQQTLRSTIDWSYALLNEDERQAFARLGVCVGGCSADLAAAVCASDPDTVEHLLIALARQSLLVGELDQAGEGRFRMLETIREYALERVRADSLLETVRDRHARWCAQLAQAADQHGAHPDHRRWIAHLHAEADNLRAALEWFAAHDLTAALQMAAHLSQLWITRDYLYEGRTWLTALLERAAAAHVPESVRAAALLAAGHLANEQGDRALAAALSFEALVLYRTLGDRHGIAAALRNLGRASYGRSDYAAAEAFLREGLEIYRDLGEDADVGRMLQLLSIIAKDHGEFDRALQLLGESLEIARRVGNRRETAYTLLNMSIVAYWQGDYTRTRALSFEALALHQELEDATGAAYALDNIGMSAYKHGDTATAFEMLGESLKLFQRAGDKTGIALILNELGTVALAAGDSAQAALRQQEGLRLAWQIGDRRRVAFCLEGLAAALAECQPMDAAQIYGAAESIRMALQAPLPPAEQSDYAAAVQHARAAAPDPAAFTAAWAAARAAPVETVIALWLA